MITSRILRNVSLPLVTLALAGCVSDMSAVSILGFEFIDVDSKGVCVPSGTSLVQGRLDTAVGTGYMVGVNVTNDLPDNADLDADRIASNTIYLDTAEVRFRASKGAAFQTPAPERLPLSIVIPPGRTHKAAMQVLSTVNGQTLEYAERGFLIIEVRLTGKTADGAAVIGSPAEFPVQVCSNCISPCGPGEEIVQACSPGQPDGVVCAEIDDA